MRGETMNAISTNAAGLGFALALLASALPGRAAEPPADASKPVVVTNFVRVTNIVIVTNYVVTTKVVLSTNALAIMRTNSSLPDLSWVPPADKFDWIQIKSGEWLKGRLKAMQERKLEFDSEELELLSFDWKDIRQVRSPNFNEMLFEHDGDVAGPITITPEHVIVGGENPRVLPRSELQSITPGGAKERNHWSGRVSAGLTLHSGNTKSVDYNAQASLQRRTPGTRLTFDYIGNISRVDDVESANNHRVNAEFDYWLSRRLYLIVPLAEYYKDPFQNIQQRFTLGAGAGYDLIYRPGLEWSVSTGPAYQRTKFVSVQPGEPPERSALALTFGTKFDWEITRRIDLVLEYRGQYTSKEVGETFHHSVITLELDLTKRFDLDVSFVWDHVQSPQQESSGAVPKKDDFRLVLGLGARF